jgi:glutamate-1-semialdehyde 2,1-aminomutase
MPRKNSKLKKDAGALLWKKAKKIIPGGSQLSAKRSEFILPENWPSYYSKAKGIEITGLDGKKYTDMMYMGIGACLLGYADKDVDNAVKKAVDSGSMTSLNCPEEVELAKVLLNLHPWAGMVRYTRTGSEAMGVAVRIARTYTGRDKIAFCGYHGWHDWYISANLANKKSLDGHILPGLKPSGVPRALKSTCLPFYYNKIDELKKIVAKHKDIGIIAVEPSRHLPLKKEFFREVRKIASRIGAVLIFDEIQVGWTLNLGGMHKETGVHPDIVVYSKAIANGYPMAAVIGKEKVMQSAQDTFLSSTFWSERIGPSAALATIKKMKEKNVQGHIKKIGKLIQSGWRKAAEKSGIDIKIGEGTIAKPEFFFNYGDQNQAIRTLYTQEMLKRGFLDVACAYITYAHKEHHIEKYMKVVEEVFGFLTETIKKGEVNKKLEGPVAFKGFKRIS